MSTIDGVLTVPLRRIPDERGTIFHMLRADDPHFVAVRRDLLHERLRGRRQGLAQAPGHDAQLRVRARAREGRALRRPGGLADARDGAGGLPRPRRALARRHPAGDLDRGQGHDQPVRDRRQLLPRTRTIPSGRRASTPSTTTSRTTGTCGCTDGRGSGGGHPGHGEGRRASCTRSSPSSIRSAGASPATGSARRCAASASTCRSRSTRCRAAPRCSTGRSRASGTSRTRT